MKAAIYARYSSDNQREESLDAQIRAATEFAQRNGYTIVRKTKYSTYHCGHRYRTKNCNNKPVNRNEIEKVVIQNLQQKLGSRSTIEHLADKLLAHYKKTTPASTVRLS